MDIPALSINECTGCGACFNLNCGAIEMKTNKEGFYYPDIDFNKCIKCYKCIDICPSYLKKGSSNKKAIFYAGYSKDVDILEKSSSGGLFVQISREILKKKGIVFGAAFDKNLDVEHQSITLIKDLKKIRGSKYVQSNTKRTYSEAKLLLENNYIVLYSGTPCQIAGLYSFLGKTYLNLYTVDIICHGVPSPGIFLEYKKTIEKAYKSKITDINFRDKEKGWERYSLKFTFEDGQIKRELAQKNKYIYGFLKNLYLRKSCYSCNYKKIPYYADVTLGDFWGVKKKYPKLYNKDGVSLLIVNSIKGFELIDLIKNSIVLKRVNESFSKKHNQCLVKPVKENTGRKKFFEDISNGFDYAIQERLKRGIIS